MRTILAEKALEELAENNGFQISRKKDGFDAEKDGARLSFAKGKMYARSSIVMELLTSTSFVVKVLLQSFMLLRTK